MGSILEAIADWLKELLISGIMGNLTGVFDAVNSRVGEIAADVGQTPANFSPGITERKVDTTETARTDTATTTGGWTETAVTVTTVQQNDREWEVTWEKNYTYPDPETPEKPEEPETPDTPDVPETPPVEDIPEEDVPKTDIPVEDEPLVEIPDEEVPATDIPVADVPQTGDDSGMWYILLMASLAGLAVMGCLEIRDKRKTTVD